MNIWYNTRQTLKHSIIFSCCENNIGSILMSLSTICLKYPVLDMHLQRIFSVGFICCSWVFYIILCDWPWWRHQMETFSALLAFVRWIHRSLWFPRTKASNAELWCFFDLRLNKGWSKQWWSWWFEMPSHSLWCHCNDKPWPSRMIYISQTPGACLNIKISSLYW